MLKQIAIGFILLVSGIGIGFWSGLNWNPVDAVPSEASREVVSGSHNNESTKVISAQGKPTSKPIEETLSSEPLEIRETKVTSTQVKVPSEAIVYARENWTVILDDLSRVSTKKERAAAWSHFHELQGAMETEDWKDMLTLAFTYPSNMNIRGWIALGMREFVKNDINAAQSFFRDLPAIERKKALDPLVRAMTRVDPEKAWDWIDSIQNEDAGNFITRNEEFQMRFGVISALGHSLGNPDKAMQFVLKIENRQSRDALANTVAEWIVEGDPSKALSKTQTGGKADKYIMDAIIGKWAETDPTIARNWLINNTDLASEKSIGAVAKNLVLQSQGEELNQFYNTLSNTKHRDTVASQAAAMLVRNDLEKAAEWLNLVESESYKKKAVGQALFQLGVKSNFQDHIDFITLGLQSDFDERTYFLAHTLKQFKEQDSSQVNEYLEHLKNSEPEMYAEVQKRLE